MNLSASWGLEIDPGVFKSLRKLPRKDAQRLLEAIRLFPEDPYAGDVVKMQGVLDSLRRRIGAYRILYKLLKPERKIVVFRIARRTSATY